MSVVICAYTSRRWPQLVAAVDSVLGQESSVRELVLVVDYNEELCERAIRELRSVTVVPNAGPRGLSGARNTGTSVASGDIVVFLDDDAVADSDWTSRLLAGYSDPDVLGVGGSAVPAWEQTAPKWWPTEFHWVVGCTYLGQPIAAAPVRNLMGCNMSFRRDVLQAVGGFDTGLGRTASQPLGGEETELCIRASQRFPGGRFMYEPSAAVHHFVPVERASWRYFRARCRAEGLSKARIANRVGSAETLIAETSYTRRVLPAGVLRNVRQGFRGDLSGMARAGAIVAGLWFTAASFGTAKVSRIAHPGRAS